MPTLQADWLAGAGLHSQNFRAGAEFMRYQAVRTASFGHSHVPAVTAIQLPFSRDPVTASLPWLAGIRICRPFKGSQLPFARSCRTDWGSWISVPDSRDRDGFRADPRGERGRLWKYPAADSGEVCGWENQGPRAG